MKGIGRMIFSMELAHIIGLMEKFSIKSSKISIKEIGFMERERASEVFSTPMGADMKVTLSKT
jgi:hypothetical protein